jgi:hypothetical protein
MAFATEIFEVTNLLGNQGTEAAAAQELIRLIYRTIQAETWFAMGGLATARSFFNPVAKKWYLAVYSEIPRADLAKHLAALSA